MGSLRRAHVLIDMCTQRDYLAAEGARPALNASEAAQNVKHLMAFSRWAKYPTLSCIDVFRFDDMRGLPSPTCIAGTFGQRKLSCTLLPSRIVVDSDNCLSVSLELLEHYQQAIFTKHHRDPFTNPKIDRLLTEMPARGFIVFGVGLEASIRLLVLGLLLRGRRVSLIQDACGFWNEGEGMMTLRQLSAKGCDIRTTQQFIEAEMARERQLRLARIQRRRSVA
jgi:nicotinamidase-related amidase